MAESHPAVQLKQLWSGLSVGQRIGLGGAAALAAVAVITLLAWARSPEYGVLYSGLSEQDAAAIAEELDKSGVDYRLDAGGTIVRVPQGQIARLRLSLAGRGLPQRGSLGFESLASDGLGGLGLTQSAQRLNYQRALEGELARTIEGLEAVRTARVHLVLPEPSVFASQEGKPSASVVLQLAPGRSLGDEQVWAIASVVGGSVEGLSPEKVTVVDAQGNVLAEGLPPDGSGVGLRQTNTRLSMEQQVEADLRRRLQTMLDNALGAGQSVVEVSARLNWEELETTTETFQPGGEQGAVRSAQEIIESEDPQALQVGGVPGMASNEPLGDVPTYPLVEDDGEGAAPRYRREATYNYEVSRSLAHSTRPSGSTDRLTVAIALDADAVDPIQAMAVESMIRAAAGLDRERGDVLTVELVPFNRATEAPPAAEVETSPLQAALPYARLAAPAALLLLALWWARRGMRGLETILITRATLEPYTLSTNGNGRRLPPPGNGHSDEEKEELQAQLQRQRTVAQLARENPEAVARVIQRWMAEDR